MNIIAVFEQKEPQMYYVYILSNPDGTVFYIILQTARARTVA